MKRNCTKNSDRIVALGAGALAAALTLSATGGTFYVDGAIGNDNDNGQTWPTAFKTFQKALSVASGQTEDEIWVAVGTYYPDEIDGGDSDDRDDTFSLVDGVAVYGGFLNGDDFEDRDPENNITILSGDIEQDDAHSPAEHWDDIQGDNSKHVVTANTVGANTILDGFIITAGDSPISGGGVFIIGANGSSPRISNCTLMGNRSTSSSGGGGGIWVSDNQSQPIIRNCTFTNNFAKNAGGGLYSGIASPVVVNCRFSGNECDTSFGGGVYLELNSQSGTPKVINCVFSGNSCGTYGGAIGVVGAPMASGETAEVINCLMFDNDALRGGAIYTYLHRQYRRHQLHAGLQHGYISRRRLL